MKKAKTAIIIGAGPAGLTAAYELLAQTNITPLVFEASGDIGGISKTVRYKGNRIDIGGHRFFSKSDRIMDWWLTILPLENTTKAAFTIRYQNQERTLKTKKKNNPALTDDVMLVRSRQSRIYHGGKFYNYPISLEKQTLKNLGARRITRMGLSYAATKIKPRRVQNLEDFYINRFGRELYQTFFKEYTEKVWGVPCSDIAADWGSQRVQGLSVSKAVMDAVKKTFSRSSMVDISQKKTEKSLIEYFLYPKLGPGHMWETVAKHIKRRGGTVASHHVVTKLHASKNSIKAVDVLNTKTGETQKVTANYFFSTMPISELVGALHNTPVPASIQRIAAGLPFRDFITVGLLVKRLRVPGSRAKTVRDNWIYIQEPGIVAGRLQIFNNWSPHLVKDPSTVWIGVEYFVQEGDDMWQKSDKAMAAFAAEELASMGLLAPADVLDSTVIRIKKTYPAYAGTYSQFPKLRRYLDTFENLYLIGRNGQHRYNNQDHSMLTAMEAVDNIRTGRRDKNNIWDVNADSDYHETK